MEIIILGCGASTGVPVIGCSCDVCTSTNQYNKRMRCAIIIQSAAAKILVDFGPEIRLQLLKHKIANIDAVICTHDHADHTAGISDLKAFTFIRKNSLLLYSDINTLSHLQNKYSYMFSAIDLPYPFLLHKSIDYYDTLQVKDLRVQTFKQIHGYNTTLGLKINNTVYSNDISSFPPESYDFLRNLETWIIDCVNYQSTNAHSGLEEVLKWNNEFKPKKIYLTNLSHSLEYNKLLVSLPKHIIPTYDGMQIPIV